MCVYAEYIVALKCEPASPFSPYAFKKNYWKKEVMNLEERGEGFV